VPQGRILPVGDAVVDGAAVRRMAPGRLRETAGVDANPETPAAT